MLGVGAGYLEPEFRAIGANFAERGAVTDEYLDAMTALWYDEHPVYRGRFVGFAGVDAHPRPRQRPIPLVVGGHSARGVSAGRHPRPRMVRLLAHARSKRRRRWQDWPRPPRRSGRPADLGELEISVTPNARLTPALVEAYAAAGVHRLVPFAPPTPDGPARTIEVAAAAVTRV